MTVRVKYGGRKNNLCCSFPSLFAKTVHDLGSQRYSLVEVCGFIIIGGVQYEEEVDGRVSEGESKNSAMLLLSMCVSGRA